MHIYLARLLLLIPLMLTVPSAFSQTLTQVAPTQRMIASEKKQLGWIPHAQIGTNLSFTSNQDVVGQTNGSNQTYGLNFKGELNQVKELTEWRNSLIIQGATTKSAALPRFVKTNDDTKYETAFLYSLPSLPEIGPYVNGSVETQLFNGEDVQANDTNYVIHSLGGSTSNFTGQTLHLTDPFKPLTTRESVGMFWKAVEREGLNLETRLGLGAMQVNADNQFALGGKNAQGATDVNELKSFQQLGVEAGAVAKGKVDDHSNWEASANILTPFAWSHTPGDDRGSVRLTNVELKAKLTTAITTWASFSYDYKFLVQPQLVDVTQQTHMLVLNINYNLL